MTHAPTTHSPIDVLVREVGLRDGLQNTATIVPTDGKLAWIVAELAAGVREIEVTSFVPPNSYLSSPTLKKW